jgi:hypothetical protein
MQVAGVEEERIERWLARLRDGSERDKVVARRGLAGVFERRGMLEEAIELLEHNLRVGADDAATLRWLSQLYQAQGDELGSLEAAMTASKGQATSSSSALRSTIVAEDKLPHPSAIRALMPYLAIVVVLGITIGAILWAVTVFLQR